MDSKRPYHQRAGFRQSRLLSITTYPVYKKFKQSDAFEQVAARIKFADVPNRGGTMTKIVLSPRMAYLKAFQNQRLRTTYSDFVEQPSYRRTCDFFFDVIYAVEDTSAREAAVKEFYEHLKKVLGGDIMACLGALIELQRLTNSLDQVCADQLDAMGAPIEFNMDIYEQAYRETDNYDDRMLQINELNANLRLSHRIFRRFGIGPGLKALHSFQSLRGEGEVTAFLVQAYDAIHGLRRIEPLAEAIVDREVKRLDRIYAGEAYVSG